MTKKTNKQNENETTEIVKEVSCEIKQETPTMFMGLERMYPPTGDLTRRVEPAEIKRITSVVEIKRISAVKDEKAPKTPFDKKQEKVRERLARQKKDGIIL